MTASLRPLWTALALAMLTVQSATAADLKLNEELRGKFPADPRDVGGTKVYMVSYTLKLKAGQRVTVSASAIGDGRAVLLALANADGKATHMSWNCSPRQVADLPDAFAYGVTVLAVRGNEAKVVSGAIPADGTYSIHLASNFSGDYTLLVNDPKAKPEPAKRDAAVVRKEIEHLRAQLGLLQKELEALEKK